MHYLLIKIQLLWAKHTKWLDRNPVKVPVSKRVIAYAIDWAVGGIISGFPAVLFYGGITGRSDMFSDLYVFPSLGFPTYWSYLAGILCIVVAFVYYIYIPYKKYPGQTLAKHWLKIKIVNNDDYSDVSLKTLIIRQGVGLFLLEGSAIVVTNYLRQMLTLATGFYFDYYLKMIGMVITMISGVFVLGSASQRSIHDYLAKTRVVGEDEKPAKIKEKKNNSGTETNRTLRYLVSFLVIMGLLVVLFFWNIGVGSVEMSFSDFWSVLTKHQPDAALYQIVWKIRLPRIIAAMLLGGALSVSGFLLQSFFQNPIAGPYVLGISSGAKLVVALTMIFLLEKGIMVSSLGMVVAAFAGSLLAMGFVLLISFRVSNMSLLVVCGILIGYICSAITDFCVTFADDSNIVNLHNWSMGSFSGMSWEHIRLMVIIVGITVVITFGLAKPISAYQMGESYARNMGVNVKVLRIALILLSSLLSACVTAFAGPISFVGIAVPHLIKLATHTAKPIILIPGCFLGGAVITLFCDGIARTVFAPTEISISSVTAVFLVPVVIAAMLRKQRM